MDLVIAYVLRIKYGFKTASRYVPLSLLLLAGVSLVFFDFRNTTVSGLNTLCDFYMTIGGFLLFSALANDDLINHCKEIISTKRNTYWHLLNFRWAIHALFLLAVNGLLFALFTKDLTMTAKYAAMATINGCYLGTIGYTLSHLFSDNRIGYIGAFAYYLLDFMTKGDWTGKLYLFTLNSDLPNNKMLLFIITLLLLAVNSLMERRRPQYKYQG